ncbi:hypothetical protein CB0940_02077 [Cercospora beticola]|uniref:Uncharacterized protein n=1 Tax=Cercospora beticola TaxID=122368 RepID=A0A2G5I9Z8_CERBT|nr:hypothetical protein CB0940_02077 [Cercospora beticola]PIB01599.1 hypothetical protein CB0940_02077 [Cercospora beticola]WPA97547.1 hypothetical protein RHO25_002157 [Cercospora beticola]
MPAITRRGRASKVVKNVAPAARRQNPAQDRHTSRKPFASTRGQRGRARGRGSHRPTPARNVESVDKQVNASEQQIIASAHPDPKDAPGTPKVTRVYTELFESKPTSLSFVSQGNLPTSPDVETMTLNLMDFCLLEDNWNPALSHNKLAASCFYFASKIVESGGGIKITPEDVARAFEQEAEMSASAWMMWMAKSGSGASQQYGPAQNDDAELRERAKVACQVSADDVETGSAILLDMRDRLGESVGEYRDALMGLSLSKTAEHEQEPETSVAVSGEAVKTSEQDLVDDSLFNQISWESKDDQEASELLEAGMKGPELVELDDFEASVEDFAS